MDDLPLLLDQGGTRARVDCTDRPGALEKFLQWCDEHEEQSAEIKWLIIQHYSRRFPDNSNPDISLCLLYRILARLPELDALSLHGLVLSSCTINAHVDAQQHASRPIRSALNKVIATWIAIRYPFDCDPLSLCNIAPNVTVFYMTNWWALPRLPFGVHLPRPPQAMFGPPPSMDMRLTDFTVSFCCPNERQLYRVSDEWYDYTQRLPTNRGTRYLTIEDIDSTSAPAIGAIISADSSTLELLELTFQPHFQDCPQHQWAGLSFAHCRELYRVKLVLPIVTSIRNEEPGNARFDAVADLIALLPRTVRRIIVILDVLQNGPFAASHAAAAVPWSAIDNYLLANQSASEFKVRAQFPLERAMEGAKVVEEVIKQGMPYALRDGRLLFSFRARVPL